MPPKPARPISIDHAAAPFGALVLILSLAGVPSRLGLTVDEFGAMVGGIGTAAASARLAWPSILRGIAALSRAIHGQPPAEPAGSSESTTRREPVDPMEPASAESNEALR